MATYTPNYNLKKPDANDNYNVQDQNGNMDIIDAALETKETPSGAQAKADAAEASAATYAEGLFDGLAGAGRTTETVAENKSLIGILTNLLTTAKDNLVNAVNEIYNSLTTHLADYVLQIPYATATGTANTYAVTLDPAPTSYVAGMAIAVKINVDNTGASTINVNGLGAKTIKKPNGNDVAAGNLKTGSVYTLRFNGTNFILQGSDAAGNATPDDVLAGKTFTNDYGEQTGTMPNRTTDQWNTGVSKSGNTLMLKAPYGYYNGSIYVKHTDDDWVESNIVAGKNVFGKVGTYDKIYGTGDEIVFKSNSSDLIRKACIASYYTTDITLLKATLYDMYAGIYVSDRVDFIDLRTNKRLMYYASAHYRYFALDDYIMEFNSYYGDRTLNKYDKSTLTLLNTYTLPYAGSDEVKRIFPSTGNYFYGCANFGDFAKFDHAANRIWNLDVSDSGTSAKVPLFIEGDNGYGYYHNSQTGDFYKIRLSDGYIAKQITIENYNIDIMYWNGALYTSRFKKYDSDLNLVWENTEIRGSIVTHNDEYVVFIGETNDYTIVNPSDGSIIDGTAFDSTLGMVMFGTYHIWDSKYKDENLILTLHDNETTYYVLSGKAVI